jgi:uncharacterized protein (TIGR02466 family)
MAIEGWFYTPIYYNFVQNENLDTIQSSVATIINDLKFEKRAEWGEQNHSLSDPTFGENLIRKYNLDLLKQEIDTNVKSYINSFTDYDYKIDMSSSWLTLTKPSESATVHNHGDSDISGVYYFKTNGDDGSIFFMNPLPSLITSNFLSSDEVVSYKPEIGKLILFPSWLYHGVRSNDTTEDRISLSFNYKVSR